MLGSTGYAPLIAAVSDVRARGKRPSLPPPGLDDLAAVARLAHPPPLRCPMTLRERVAAIVNTVTAGDDALPITRWLCFEGMQSKSIESHTGEYLGTDRLVKFRRWPHVPGNSV